MFREPSLGKFLYFLIRHIFIADFLRVIKASFGLPTDGYKISVSPSGMVNNRELITLTSRIKEAQNG